MKKGKLTSNFINHQAKLLLRKYLTSLNVIESDINNIINTVIISHDYRQYTCNPYYNFSINIFCEIEIVIYQNKKVGSTKKIIYRLLPQDVPTNFWYILIERELIEPYEFRYLLSHDQYYKLVPNSLQIINMLI